MKLYNELAEYYYSIEKKHRNIRDDVLLIVSLLEGLETASILDIGCGTGEHINRLSKYGYYCIGIDNSEDMLKIARSRFPDSGRFEYASMQEFNYFEEFDMAISLFGSFNYLIDDKDINKVLLNTWKALKPNGIGLFEIWNSFPIDIIQEKPLSHISTTLYNNTLIRRERGFSIIDTPGKTVVEVNYLYKMKMNDIDETVTDRHVMRAFSKKEMDNFLDNNGFVIKNYYSNSNRVIYNEISSRMVIHFKK